MIDAYRGRMATRYDAIWRTFTARMLAPVVELAQPCFVPGGHVLDIGCGTGVLLAHLLHAQPTLAAMGSDASTDMLAQAHARLGPHVPLVEWNLDCEPPLPVTAAAPFTLITCTNVVHYLREPTDTLTTLRRLLAPDGRIIVADFIRHAWWWPAFEALLHAADRAHRHTLTGQGLAQLIQASGFALQTMQPVVVNALWHGAVVVGQRKKETI